MKTNHRKVLSAKINRMQNDFTFSELSEKINVPGTILYQWVKKEELKARKAKNALGRWIWLILQPMSKK